MRCKIKAQSYQSRQYVVVTFSKEARTYQNKQPGKKTLYYWILHHSQILQYPINNYCLKVYFGVHYETQLVPKLLLPVSVKELHKQLVSPTEEGGLMEARYESKIGQIIISSLVILCYIAFFHPKTIIYLQGTRSCVVLIVPFLPKVWIHIYYNDGIII